MGIPPGLMSNWESKVAEIGDATGSRLPESGYAGWSDPTTTDVKGNLLFEDGRSRVEECSIRALRLGPVHQRRCLANASGGLATFDDPEAPSGV